MSRRKLNLTARVARVFRAVKKLERRGHNPTDDYDYTRATDVFAEVRDRLFADGILLQRDEAEPVYVDKDTNGEGWLQECRLRVTYSFTDGEATTAPEHCNGIARKANSDKALYTAQTGADKAFLKRKGLMAEVIDDPEFDQPDESAGESLDDVAPPRVRRLEKPLTDYQVSAIREGMAVAQRTEEELAQAVAAIGFADTLANVKRKYFKALFRWASDGRGTVSAPKIPAVPDQGALPLRAAREPIQMKIGSKSIEFEAKEKGYAL